MTSPKTINRYSAHWMDLFDAFVDDPQKERVIECKTEKHAKGMRLEFYKAREALLKGLHDSKQDAEFANALNTREVKVVGTQVVFTHKDENWIGKLIAESLGKEDDDTQGS